MNLRRVELRDWKAFRHARFLFPPAEGKRNIILIGAPNGYGKTSFFEALTLGLFGREGLPLIPRATFDPSGDGDGKLQTSYNQFLKEAIHKRAITDGRPSCSIELEFEDDDGEKVVLKRTWHFSANGQHKPRGRRTSYLSRHGQSRPWSAAYRRRPGRLVQGLCRADIPSLAVGGVLPFSMANGCGNSPRAVWRTRCEKASRASLGMPVLRSLQDSLRRYADSRRGQVTAPSDVKVTDVKASIAAIEDEITSLNQRIEEAEAVLPRLESDRDEIARDLSRLGGGSQAMLQDLIRDEQRLQSTVEKEFDELQKLLAGDLAIALAGEALREATVLRLEAEEVREKWEVGRRQGAQGLDRFLERLNVSLSSIKPKLGDDQLQAVLSEAKAAWDALWYPPPANCADFVLHGHLQGVAREQACSPVALGRQHLRRNASGDAVQP